MSIRSSMRGLVLALSAAAPMLILPVTQAHAGVFISVNVGPPVLPVYAQPPLPAPGYIWTPGYWAYGDAGYYWVPGVWVQPPRVGVLWTPGYWGFVGGAYAWHPAIGARTSDSMVELTTDSATAASASSAVSGAAESSPTTVPWRTLAAFT